MTRRWCVRVAFVVAAAVTLAGCGPTRTTQSLPTASRSTVPVTVPGTDAAPRALLIGSAATGPPTGPPPDRAGGLTIGSAAVDTWSGWLPDGRTFSPFDTVSEPITRLDPLLLKAIQDAARAAAGQGVAITLTSGWRSRGFQQRLFADAVRQYGSVDVARQFVAAPDTSRHVVGEAVDVAGTGVSEWLIRNGAQFGLCQIYANENWHFELAVDDNGRCPPLRANAAG